MNIRPNQLEKLVKRIFNAIGCSNTEADQIGRLLVRANVRGHDSHGVVRIAQYVQFWRQGDLKPNQAASIIFENQNITIFNGNKGFGQTIGKQVVERGVEQARFLGIAMIGVRNVGHLGRIGDWAELAAEMGQTSLHFVNNSGSSTIVAPFGGTTGRYSTNPICIGMPRANGKPIIFDAATSALAEGKVKIARNTGVKLPPDVLFDAAGNPSQDPNDLYTEPRGSLKPMAAHKGSGLAIMIELLAGALMGAGCCGSGVTSFSNGMMSIYINPEVFADQEVVQKEVQRFIDWVRQSRPAQPNDQIYLPGEPETNTENRRRKTEIRLDDTTWQQITTTAGHLNVSI